MESWEAGRHPGGATSKLGSQSCEMKPACDEAPRWEVAPQPAPSSLPLKLLLRASCERTMRTSLGQGAGENRKGSPRPHGRPDMAEAVACSTFMRRSEPPGLDLTMSVPILFVYKGLKIFSCFPSAS